MVKVMVVIMGIVAVVGMMIMVVVVRIPVVMI